ncbi:MAG: hypothetical protein IJJ13_04020 [Lachnospiraceae bacterium]|nr:hypothetical protein [Lachnospiraceae bacterium]
MKLIGKLKEKVSKAENKAQAKELIADAGMELTDEEMDKVSGGATNSSGMELPSTPGVGGQWQVLTCSDCGVKTYWFDYDPVPTCSNYGFTNADPSAWGLDPLDGFNPAENRRTL